MNQTMFIVGYFSASLRNSLLSVVDATILNN